MTSPESKNPDTEPVARSLASFVEAIANLDATLFPGRSLLVTPWRRPWFRGQGDASYPLVPTVYRETANEDELRNEFQRRAPALMDGDQPRDPWGWYFLMRHYGVPTRLLDWTEGSLIALHFALTSHVPGMAAAVWMLNPWWLNQTAVESPYIADPGEPIADTYLPAPFSKSPLPELPVAIQPHHVSRRIAVQRGFFTVHGSAHDGFTIAAAKASVIGLAKVTVPEDAIASLRVELDRAGITETTVFPDLEGLSRELQNDYVSRTNPPKSP